MEPSLALYRRYRPETFAEVIGQDHVTEPLRAALANNRVNHAYLFSGPRGCGKTTSARILARALNCARAPISDPCGECDSCRELARGGSGSMDVIEMDAATHNGVDDARDLREKAFFAPVRDRFKIYIIDEAHMVTSAAFNALLKLVEEPPEHLKFIFATTEPEKVIPTIRSRTHHYPFRLIPPRTLATYLDELCAKEGVTVDPAALPLVVRAGAGSARDTLSVLDQLLGGAGPDGLTYETAVGLLGYTPDALLDEVVDAFAAADGRGVFGVVDKVIETGQDPRRFTEDVLRRLRDLVIVSAVPDAPASGLIDVPEDQAERLVSQAARFGRAELVRAADLVAAGLTEMRGATAPRLLLELICARVLLPGADHGTDGLAARMDRIERRVSIAPASAAPAPVAAPAPAAEPRADRPPAPTPTPAPEVSAPPVPAPEPAPVPVPEPEPAPAPAPEPTPVPAPEPTPPPAPAPVPVPEPVTEPTPEPVPAPEPEPAAAGTGGLGLAEVRRVWPDVLDRVKGMRRFTWILVSQNAQVVGVDATNLTVGFKNAGARDSFLSGGSEEILQQAILDLLGASWKIDAIVDPSADTSAPMPAAASAPEPRADRPPPPSAPAPDGGMDDGPPPDWASAAPAAPAAAPAAPAVDPDAIAAARSNITPTRPAGPMTPVELEDDPDQHVDREGDADADDTGMHGAELLERELGATVIDDIPHD